MKQLDVQVGDRVLVSNHSCERLSIVERVTPTGRIRISNGWLFNSSGMRNGSYTFSSARLTIASTEDIQRVEKADMARDLKHVNWSSLDHAQLQKITDYVISIGGLKI